MDYQIAVAPELDLDVEDFITVWNDTPECQGLAEAQLSTQPSKGFPLDPELVQQGLIVLTAAATAAGTLGLDVVKDALKDKLTEYLEQKLSRKPSIKVESIRQPGGAYLLVVTEEGE